MSRCRCASELAGTSPHAAFSATAGTAAPAPAAAPRTQSGGWVARKTTERAKISTSPGTMKHSPPRRAPAGPRSRQAQKMASWVDAGPGSRFVVAMASSNSFASIHCRSSTQRRRSNAIWVGGPPNPMQPRRSHSLTIVGSATRFGAALLDLPRCSSESRRRAPHRPALSAGAWSTPGPCDPWPSPHRNGEPARRRPRWLDRRRPSASILWSVG